MNKFTTQERIITKRNIEMNPMDKICGECEEKMPDCICEDE